MPEIVTDFQPFENSKKPLKTIAHCDFAPRFLPTKIREEPKKKRRYMFAKHKALPLLSNRARSLEIE